MKKLLLFLLLGFSAFAQPSTAPVQYNTGSLVVTPSLLRFNFPKALSDATDPLGLVTLQQLQASTNKYQSYVDVRDFGVVPNNLSVDYSTNLQNAINYAETNGINSVFLPPGITVGQIVLRTAKFWGVRPQPQPQLDTNAVSILAQPVTPTDATIVVTNNPSFGNSTPEISDIYILGRGDITTPNKKAITQVDSKYVFRVANADAPTLYVVADNPSQVAFFYTSDDRYLGSGEVTGTSVSGGNTIITLDPNYSTFAATDSSGILTTANKVVFSPSRTVNGTTFVDPASAGYAGIRVNASFALSLNNVSIDKHHVGLQVQNNGSASMRITGENLISHCEYAGIISEVGYGLTDSIAVGSVYISGGYVWPGSYYLITPSNTETNTITNPFLRNNTWGFVNAFSESKWSYIGTDSCVGGMKQRDLLTSRIDYALFDNAIRYGAVFQDGWFSPAGGGVSFGHLEGRAKSVTNSYLNAITRNFLTVNGTLRTNQIRIGSLSVSMTSSAGCVFSNLFMVSGISGHSIYVGQKMTLDGVSQLGTYPAGSLIWMTPADATSATDQSDGWWTAGGTSGLSHAGTNVATFGGTNSALLNPLTSPLVVVSTVTTQPTSNATNVVQFSNASGQSRLRMDTSNGRTYINGPGGAEGTDPTFNTGTTLVVKNNTSTTDRSRIAVVAGTNGFAILELGSVTDLNAGLQYDIANSVLSIKNVNNTRILISALGQVVIGGAATAGWPDAAFTLSNTATPGAFHYLRATTVQRDAWTPQEAFTLANSTLHRFQYYNGTRWYSLAEELPVVSSSVIFGALTALTPANASATVTVTGAQTGDFVSVSPPFLNNGSTLVHGVVTSANTVTLTASPLAIAGAQTNTMIVKVTSQ